jgi:hypothetical protein
MMLSKPCTPAMAAARGVVPSDVQPHFLRVINAAATSLYNAMQTIIRAELRKRYDISEKLPSDLEQLLKNSKMRTRRRGYGAID